MDQKIVKDLKYDFDNFIKHTDFSNIIEIYKILKNLYNDNKSPVSDEIYDKLEDFIREKKPNLPILEEVGGEISGKKYKLPFIMGSLEKIKTGDTKLKNFKINFKGPYILMDKLDGISALCHFKNGKINMYTRGTAYEGRKINKLIPYFKLKENVFSNKIFNSEINEIAVKGEIIVKKKLKINNPRNYVAGLVARKNKKDKEYENLHFVCYEIIFPKFIKSIQLSFLKNIGFEISWYKSFIDIDNEFLLSILNDRLLNSKYQIDGIVISDSSKIHDDNNGRLKPLHSKAFKDLQTDEIVIVVVNNIIWELSKKGKYTPIVIIDKTKLSDGFVTRITAHNASYIIQNKLGLGSKIKITRSIVPIIIEVLSPGEIIFPESYFWNNKDIYSKDENNSDVKIKEILHFIKTLKIDGIGPGTIKTLYMNKAIKSIYDLITISKEELEEYNIMGIGDSIISKIMNIKDKIKNVNIITLIVASNKMSPGFGEKKLKKLFSFYPNFIKNFYEIPNDAIPGFSEKSMITIKEDFEYFFEWLYEHPSITWVNPEIITDKPGLFENEKILFTGFRNKNLENLFKENGALIEKSFTNNITLLIVKNKKYSSTKTEKANNKGISIITESEAEEYFLF